ncbi:hypothetical protein [Aquirufa aurantiipilula]|uniref:Uncharacterized protein n=1 Tax=Aquirufa aurantiipilula TaxID=2696561 RepID=A0ABT6BN47_9BACT|nr:hypothetical protein [Aquirufa aurantiipilula]MDF5691601.1 hypothetical protein [Aquirufa aurantiipilula]
MIEDNEDESDIPPMHNFRALNQIKIKEPTAKEIRANQKLEEAKKKVAKYDMLFDGMYQLMLKSALKNENLDVEYENLKGWQAFM